MFLLVRGRRTRWLALLPASGPAHMPTHYVSPLDFPLPVGIEDVEDLIADLDQAFNKAASAAAAKGQQQAAGQSAYEP